MKHCEICSAELPTGISEFGGYGGDPLCCQNCWLELGEEWAAYPLIFVTDSYKRYLEMIERKNAPK